MDKLVYPREKTLGTLTLVLGIIVWILLIVGTLGVAVIVVMTISVPVNQLAYQYILKEGALAWLDCWAITRRSNQVALTAEWINYMLDPAVSREFTRRQGLANTPDEPPALAGDVPGGTMGPIV